MDPRSNLQATLLLSRWSLRTVWRNEVVRAATAGLVASLATFHEYFLYGKTYITETDSQLIFAYRASASVAMKTSREFPLWNPLTFTGTSWIGQDVQSNIIHLFDVFFAAIKSPVAAYMWGWMGLYFLAVGAAYVAFRRVLGLTVWGSVAATAIYAFNPYIHERLEILYGLGLFLGFPALVLVAHRFARTGAFRDLFACSIVVAFAFYASVVLVLEALLLSFGPLLWWSARSLGHSLSVRSFVVRYAVFSAMTVALCTPILLPAVQASLDGVRSRGGLQQPNYAYLPAYLAGQVLSPLDVFLTDHRENEHGRRSPFRVLLQVMGSGEKTVAKKVSMYHYQSLLLLPAIGLLFFMRGSLLRRAYWFFVGSLLALGVVAVVQGLPGFRTLAYQLTGGHGFVKNAQAILIFAAAGLVGLLLSELPTLKGRNWWAVGAWALALSYGVIFAVYLAFTLMGSIAPWRLQEAWELACGFKALSGRCASFSPTFEFWSRALGEFFSPDKLPLVAGIFGLRFLVIGLGFKYLSTGQPRLRALLVGVLILEAFMTQRYMGGANDLVYRTFSRDSAEARFLSTLDLRNRTALYMPNWSELLQEYENRGLDMLEPYPTDRFGWPNRAYPLMLNFQSTYLVPSYSTYLSVMPPGMAELHYRINRDMPHFYSMWGEGKWLDSEVYLFNPSSPLIDYAAIDHVFSPVPLADSKFTLLRRGDYYYIYRNMNASARVVFVPAGSLQDISGHDIAYEIGAPGIEHPAAIAGAVFGYNRVSFRVKVGESGLVVLKETYDRNWSANVDGLPQAPLRVNNLFRGLRVLPGEHEVMFRYRSPLFVVGTGIFALTMAAGLGYCIAEPLVHRHMRRHAIQKKASVECAS